MNFTEEDIKEIEAHGLTKEKVQEQVSIFKNGVPTVQLIAAATVGDGIQKLNEDKEVDFIELYEHIDKDKELLKFIPASGAATRMFKTIYQFLEEYDPKEEKLDEFLSRAKNGEMRIFFDNLKNFPFYDKISELIQDKYDKEAIESDDEAKVAFVKKMMDEDGPNFGNLPKGLLPFHNYESYMVTAFEEHLYEAAAYAENRNHANLHFTVSPEHEKAFKEQFENIHAAVSSDTEVNFEVTYSFQKPQTDTVAVTEDNEIYRKPNGKMLFRPGGHGALIENLNDVDADVIFIKNIDNVLTKDNILTLSRNKKILAGLLLELQAQAFKFTKSLKEGDLDESGVREIAQFLERDFSIKLSDTFATLGIDEKKDQLLELLDRPLRVCGMVKNEGEPGGGPFWVADKKGTASLQIIESAQIEKDDKKQQEIFQNSTHFNPVDIVCSVRDYTGKKYNLTEYVDPDLAFIASKTTDGNNIKALELPGLWNGGMAFWNTIFVEVPLETFNPVKNVNDLLKPAHQVKKS
ncbi:DUF4301 family protein [Flavimarina sp. Hel_I_48]|uniref:DUF4301 family protein n=1 Tax=Flavimarina sp. Hel_I_48 TaxID=1392488 RepID=UPI0004DF15BD|nr:DUF4301 family protein [Flavimarina sp. Hel_I_48]